MSGGARLRSHIEERRLLRLGLGAFGVFGGLWGVWAVLLVDLSRSVGLSTGPLGLALSLGVVASIPIMFFGGKAADRWGQRAVLVASGLLMGFSFAGLAFVESYPALLVILLLWCATSGVYDVAVNAFGMALERAGGRQVMSVLHAAFSMGGAFGALAAGVLLSSGVDYRFVYMGCLIPVALIVLAALNSPFPSAGRQDDEDGDGVRKAGLHRNFPLMLAGVIAALAFFSEGTMEDWSGVYLRQTLALPTMLGASGVAVYHAAMAAGRLGAASIIKRFGNRRTLQGVGLLAAGSMALALSTSSPVLIVAGFLMVGLSLAAVTPITFSVAGSLAPDRPGAASSLVATIGYNGFLVGPALVGGAAEITGLRLALGSVAIAGFMIAVLSARLAEGRSHSPRKTSKNNDKKMEMVASRRTVEEG